MFRGSGELGAPFSAYYLFSVGCDGAYRLFRFQDGQPVGLIGRMASAAIQRGPNVSNMLGVGASGNTITLYANGAALATYTDKAANFPKRGRFAVYAASADAPGLVVQFDDLRVWPAAASQ